MADADMNARTGMSDVRPPGGVIGDDERVRAELVACGQKLLSRGLLTQTSGNLSVRVGEKIYITPSSLEYDHIAVADIAVLNLDGSVSSCRTGLSPSSETPLHCMTYAARPDVAAIVHTHSGYATTLAVLGLPIPAVHYMIAVLGVSEVPIAPYATYGTEELARNVRDNFPAPARAVLLANHGMVAVGHSLKHAADAAESLEHLAGLYYRALLVGKPNVLSDAQMAEVINKYRTNVPAVATAAAAGMVPMAASTSEGSAFLSRSSGGTT
jgi:L-fuculose-phosphate aldolase